MKMPGRLGCAGSPAEIKYTFEQEWDKHDQTQRTWGIYSNHRNVS